MVFIHNSNFSRLANEAFFQGLSANQGQVLAELGGGEKLLVTFDGYLDELTNGHVIYRVGVFDADLSYEDMDRYFGLIECGVLLINKSLSILDMKARSMSEGLHLDRLGEDLDKIDEKIESLKSEIEVLKNEKSQKVSTLNKQTSLRIR